MGILKTLKAVTFLLAAALCFITGCVKTDQLLTVSQNAGLGMPCHCDLLIEREAYTLGYSSPKRQALWGSYILKKENLEIPPVSRTDDFRSDPLIKDDPVMPHEYIRSGFDRGHLAPAADMAYSRKVMSESFFMSNISPQRPGCNRRSWLEVEKLMRQWAKREGKLYIITGPVFSNADVTATGKLRLPIPGSFYKAVLDLTPPYKMIAFIVPNADAGIKVSKFAVSVDQLEKLTGYDFFDQLDDDLENELEKQNNFDDWSK